MIKATHSPNWGGPLPFAESEAVTLLTFTAECEVMVNSTAQQKTLGHPIGLSNLYAEARHISKEHFASLATQNVLPASSMLSLLKSDDLAVKSEDEVFETVVAWLKGQNRAVREAYELKLYELVRFPLLSKNLEVAKHAPVLSTLRGCELRLAQFQRAVLDGLPRPRRVVVTAVATLCLE